MTPDEYSEMHSPQQARKVNIVAILDTMWDWEERTSGAGHRTAPEWFKINPGNASGRRLYALAGEGSNLLVTNSCKELASSASQHGTPDKEWLRANLQNLHSMRPIEVLLVCGRVAQKTFWRCDWRPEGARVIEMPHPAARFVWTQDLVAEIRGRIHEP